MTTIAVRNGVVAFDSLISGENCNGPERVQKAWISTRHPVIFAFAGTVANCNAAARILDRMKVLPWDDPAAWSSARLPDLEDSSILIVHKDGRVFVIEAGGWYEAQSPYIAIGSGAMAALGAMGMRASAKRAVEVAATLDAQTGPPVNILRLSDIPTPKRPRARKRK